MQYAPNCASAGVRVLWSYPQRERERERGAHQSHRVGLMSERIECELRCPACGVWFCDPVRLQCAHSVCVRCAERLLCASAAGTGAASAAGLSAVLSCAASPSGCGAGDAAALTLAIPPPPAPLALAAADRCSASRAPPPRKQHQPQAPSTQTQVPPSRTGAHQNTSIGTGSSNSSGTPESASASTSDIVSESDSGVALGPFHASPNSCAGGPKSPGEHNGSTALGSPAHSIGALAGLAIDHKLLQQSAAQSPSLSLRIECPLCGVATCVSSVAQLPRNKLLANIVRRCSPSASRAQSLAARPLSSMSDSSGPVSNRVPLPPPSPSPSASSSSSLCHFCASNEASRRCVQCATALCEECAARSHPPTTSGPLAAHSIVPLERPRTPRSPPSASTSTSNCTTPTLPSTATAQSNPTSVEGSGPSPWALAATPAPAPAESACALHPENARRFYCSACAQVLCETCAAQATHTAHQIYPLIAAAKLHKVRAHTHRCPHARPLTPHAASPSRTPLASACVYPPVNACIQSMICGVCCSLRLESTRAMSIVWTVRGGCLCSHSIAILLAALWRLE